jgi:hypothetical protein
MSRIYHKKVVTFWLLDEGGYHVRDGLCMENKRVERRVSTLCGEKSKAYRWRWKEVTCPVCRKKRRWV